jgi:hypothetical protein
MADLDAAHCEPGGHFSLEGAHAAGIGRPRDDANTGHERIIP